MTDLLDAVLRSADAQGDRAALTHGRRTLSYRELGEGIRAVAAGLRADGLRDGDRVLFSVRPGADAVVLALGIVHAGGVVVFADPGAGEQLFRARTALAAPRYVAAESLLYLASSRPLRGLARRRGLELPPYGTLVPDARHLYTGPRLPGVPRRAVPLRTLLTPTSLPTSHPHPTPGSHPTSRPTRGESTHSGSSWASPPAETRTLTGDGGPTPASAGGGQGEALVIFTSGTTDAPKAVVHSRESLGAGLGDFAEAVGMRPGLRVLTDQLMVGVPALIAGAHWTIPPAGVDPGARPEQYLGLLPGAELLFASPAALDAILRALDADPALVPSRLETIVLGGAPVLRPLLARTVERFPGARIRAVYGMTEILPVAIADGVAKLAEPAGEGDPAGVLVPSVDARIEDGELVLSGPGLALGYLGQAPLTELRTGDLARLDHDGAGTRLTLLGRRKEMFIRGTQNVYPGLYEPIIAGLDGVADVAMAGMPDEIGDDRIVLAVVPADEPPATATPDHPLLPRVRAALPGLIDAGVLPDVVVAVPELPRSGRSRKLDRAALAASLAAFARMGDVRRG